MQFKKHLVTASYVSEAMQALDAKAKEAGVTLLCEMGLDPGIGIHLTINLLSGFVIAVSLEIHVNVVFLFYLSLHDNLLRVFAKCSVPLRRSLDGDENDRLGTHERGSCAVFRFVLWRSPSSRSCKQPAWLQVQVCWPHKLQHCAFNLYENVGPVLNVVDDLQHSGEYTAV